MPTILPVVNDGNSNLVDTLQQEIDEGIVRENETLEMIESQNDILNQMAESIQNLFSPLEKIVSLLKEEMNLEKKRAQEADDLRDREEVRDDIEEERGPDLDDSGSTPGTDNLFKDVNLDSGIIGNILGAAVMSWIFGVDDILRQAAVLGTVGILDVAVRLFNMPLQFIRKIGSTIRNLEIFSRLPRLISTALAPVRMVSEFLMTIGRTFASFAQTLAGPLRFLRPLLGPFTLIIFGIVDFVRGFIGGFKEGGLVEGLKDGFTELLSNLIGLPLDMIKDVISWLSEKMGFESISEALDEFSFTQLIRDWFQKLWDGVTAILTDPVAAIKGFFSEEENEQEERVPLPEGPIGRPGENTSERIEREGADKVTMERIEREGERLVENNNVTNNVETQEALTPTGQAIGRGSADIATQREKGRSGPAAVISAPQTDNSSVNVQNNRTQFLNKPGPRSSDHTFRSYQRGRSGF